MTCAGTVRREKKLQKGMISGMKNHFLFLVQQAVLCNAFLLNRSERKKI